MHIQRKTFAGSDPPNYLPAGVWLLRGYDTDRCSVEIVLFDVRNVLNSVIFTCTISTEHSLLSKLCSRSESYTPLENECKLAYSKLLQGYNLGLIMYMIREHEI